MNRRGKSLTQRCQPKDKKKIADILNHFGQHPYTTSVPPKTILYDILHAIIMKTNINICVKIFVFEYPL